MKELLTPKVVFVLGGFIATLAVATLLKDDYVDYVVVDPEEPTDIESDKE